MCKNCIPLTKQTELWSARDRYGMKDEDNCVCPDCHRYICEDELAKLEDK